MHQKALRGLGYLTAVSSLALLLSCGNQDTSDAFGVVPGSEFASVVSCVSGSVTVTPPSTALVPICDFGTSYVLVEMAFSGVITVTPYSGQPYQTDPRGRPWGFSSCVEGVYALSNTDGPWTAGPCTQTGQFPSSGYQSVRGAVSARWMGPIPNPPEYQSSYSGSFTVSYTRVRGTGTVKASKYVVQPGGAVTFTARVSPTTVGNGVSVPYGVRWRWVPDQPGGSNPAMKCGPWLVCTTNIPVSGTMFADFVINGEAMSEPVHIRVIPCLTGDSLLDSLPLLDAMKLAWDSSYPGGPGSGRRERTWGLDCNSFGECEITLNPIDPSTTPCHSSWPPGNPDTTMHRAGDGHTHPFDPGPVTTDTLPDNCPRGPSSPRGPRGAAPRPSRPDYESGSQTPGNHRHCVIDGDNIYCFPVGQPPATADSQTVKIPRVDSLTACRRV
jgi:hypothetical protein